MLGRFLARVQEGHCSPRCCCVRDRSGALSPRSRKLPDEPGGSGAKYLAAFPKDAFSQKALLFKSLPNGVLIYSVGPNGKDDGGASDSTWDESTLEITRRRHRLARRADDCGGEGAVTPADLPIFAASALPADSVQPFGEAAVALERGRLGGQLAVQQAARYGNQNQGGLSGGLGFWLERPPGFLGATTL